MQLDHVNLSVTNLAESVDWYRRVFGFEAVERGDHHGIPWAIVKKDGALLALYEHPQRRVPRSDELDRVGHHGVAHLGLRITDGDGWLATLARENVQVEQEWRYPHSTSWYVVDPSGWEIEVALWDQNEVKFG